jgi:hypothetical protein
MPVKAIPDGYTVVVAGIVGEGLRHRTARGVGPIRGSRYGAVVGRPVARHVAPVPT